MRLYEVRHQLAPKKRWRTLIVTEDLSEAKVAAGMARRPWMFVWEDGKVTHLYGGTDIQRADFPENT